MTSTIPLAFMVGLFSVRSVTAASSPPDVDSIACFDGGILGRSNLGLVSRRASDWQPFEFPEVSDLWQLPDGPPLGYSVGARVIALAQAIGARTEWRLPGSSGLEFSFSDGPLVASPERIYRLAPHGIVEDVGPAPVNLTGFRSPVSYTHLTLPTN